MSQDLEAIFRAIWYPKHWAKSCLIKNAEKWTETCTKYEKSKHAVKSSSTKTHSSILRLSLRQYVEQQTDITFTLFPVSLTFLEPMQRLCHPAPFHSILLNLLPEPMHVCNPAHVWTLQRLAIWSTFWLHTTFLFVLEPMQRLCHPAPYGPMQRLCHPAHFFLSL